VECCVVFVFKPVSLSRSPRAIDDLCRSLLLDTCDSSRTLISIFAQLRCSLSDSGVAIRRGPCIQPSWMLFEHGSGRVTVVNSVKTAQPSKIPFGLRTRVGPGNRVGVQISLVRGNFEGEGSAHCNV